MVGRYCKFDVTGLTRLEAVRGNKLEGTDSAAPEGRRARVKWHSIALQESYQVSQFA